MVNNVSVLYRKRSLVMTKERCPKVSGTEPEANAIESRPGAHENCEGSAKGKRHPTEVVIIRLCFLSQSQWVRGEGSRKTDSYPRRATDRSDAERAATLDLRFGEMKFLSVRGYVPSAWYQVLDLAVEDRNRVKVVRVAIGFNHWRPFGRSGACARCAKPSLRKRIAQRATNCVGNVPEERQTFRKPSKRLLISPSTSPSSSARSLLRPTHQTCHWRGCPCDGRATSRRELSGLLCFTTSGPNSCRSTESGLSSSEEFLWAEEKLTRQRRPGTAPPADCFDELLSTSRAQSS